MVISVGRNICRRLVAKPDGFRPFSSVSENGGGSTPELRDIGGRFLLGFCGGVCASLLGNRKKAKAQEAKAWEEIMLKCVYEAAKENQMQELMNKRRQEENAPKTFTSSLHL